MAADPDAYATVVGAWTLAVLLFAWLSITPGRFGWLREGAVGLAIALLVLAAADQLPSMRRCHEHALIFQPGTTVRYESAEYDMTATANNLGFRDRDFRVDRVSGVRRVLVIGDSFVFGWGLPVEQSWPKVLEQELAGFGAHTEVANLGQPGASPFQYAEVARRAVPLLHPDCVVVAISESNDLWQSQPTEVETVYRAFLRRPLKTLFPNLSDWLFQQRSPHESKDLHGLWQEQSLALLAHAPPDALHRFAALAPDVQDFYRKGLINPSELQSALFAPTSLQVFPPDDATTVAETANMAVQLRRIARVCRACGCPLLVVGIPAAECVNRPAFKGQLRAGFALDPALLNFDGLDDAAAAAAHQANVAWWSAVPLFRTHLDQPGLFFSLDNHLAANGARLLGQNVAPHVEVLLPSKAPQ
jgi:hypothetical protein